MPSIYAPTYIIVTNKICHCCGLRTDAKFEAVLNRMLLLQTQMHLLCYDEYMWRSTKNKFRTYTCNFRTALGLLGFMGKFIDNNFL